MTQLFSKDHCIIEKGRMEAGKFTYAVSSQRNDDNTALPPYALIRMGGDAIMATLSYWR